MAWWNDLPQASPLDAAISAEGITGPLAQLAQSVYMQESSGGRNTKTSNAGAVGGMQILPGTFKEVADKGWDINDPVHNARAGIRYLKKMQELGGGDPRMAAVGYYGGPGAIRAALKGESRSDPRNPDAPNTLQYAEQVLNRIVSPAQAVDQSNWWEAMPIADSESLNEVQDQAQPQQLQPQPMAGYGASGSWDQAEQPASGGGVLSGIAMGIRDPIDAGAQMLRRAVPESVGQAVDQFGNTLSQAGFPIAESTGVQGVDQLINQANQEYEQARLGAGREGMDWARLGGNIAALAPAAYATPQMLAQGITRGAAQGAMFGALQPVIGEEAQENFGSEKAGQAALGGAFGAALPAAGRVLSPLVSRSGSPSQLLASQGVQLTPGQALGGIAMRVEDRAMSLPIAGDAIRSARARGQESLNRAVYNRVLEPIGESTSKTGRAAVSEARNKISKAYDDVLEKVRFTLDREFAQNIFTLRSMAYQLPQRESRAFENILQREVLGPLSKGRPIDGKEFKNIETQLGNHAQRFKRSSDAYQQELGNALIELQRSLRENLIRLNPKQAWRLRSVNESFANFVRLESAAGRIGAHEGIFTPQQLASAIRQTDRSRRKGAYSRGDALMQDLSDAAQSRMSAKIPDSGTAERLMTNLFAGGLGYAANPLIPAGLGAAAVPYLPGISRASTAAILSRPPSAEALARGIERLPAGYLATLAGSANQ